MPPQKPANFPSLFIVVPCYNESAVFQTCLHELLLKLEALIQSQQISSQSQILFIDDGSQDHTWSLIHEASQHNPHISGIKLSRNRGHQNALLAGLHAAQSAHADITISIDADLQDDTAVIEKMVQQYLQGAEIVYGVREDRSQDTVFKRMSAGMFYKLMSSMGVPHIENHADFRLLGKKALAALLAYPESNLYLRGLVPLLGYPSTQVFYARKAREAGESKYPFKKMLGLALEGITSFSITPLRLVMALGLGLAGAAILMILFAIFQHIEGNTIPGWSSIIITILLVGGIQTFCIGIIGEYIGKIYLETKHRPRFFIEAQSGFNGKNREPQ
jgi:glycosyltransferase involved in cell wall biosynthesis